MDELTWERFKAYCYRRRNNIVPDHYYERKFNDIKRYFNSKPITYDTADQFLEWLESDFMARKGKKISNSYYNKYLTVLQICARLCGVELEYMQRNERIDAVETESLTQDEYDRLIHTTIPYERDLEYINFRDKLIIKVTVQTAQRIGNIRTLTWQDYYDSYFHIRMTKNGKPHKVYLQPHLQKELLKLKKYPHNYIFSSWKGPFDLFNFNSMLKQRCMLAGIHKNITGKSLRKTGATGYLKQKIPLHKVAKITNHQDVRVLANHYYDPEQGELEEIIENNPFDPEPLTKDKIIELCNEFISNLQKRDCQAVPIIQNKNYILTVPLEI